MAISITNLTVSTKVPNGATIGTLALVDETAKNQIANFTLTPDSAGFFGISGNNLVTVRGGIPPGNYSIQVFGNAEFVRLSCEATFVIGVTM